VTSYDPNPTLYVNGVAISDDVVINDLSVTMGRTNILDQPSPGYARASLWTTGDVPIDLNLSDPFQIKMESSLYGDPVRTNQIRNPSFETNASFWSTFNSTLARITTDSVVGTACGEFTLTAGTNGQIYTSYTWAVTPLLPYRGSLWARIPTPSASASVTVRISFYNAGLVSVGNFDTTFLLTSGADWQRISSSGIAPATAAIATMTFYRPGTNIVGDKIRVDGFLYEQSSTLNDYFDGSTVSPIGAAWTGTPNASTSTLTGELVSVFNGIISDIDIELPAYGDRGSVATYTITAVGPLASLQKKTAGSAGYPKEFDGERVLAILSEAFLTEWDDVGPLVTWNDIPTGATWDSYDGINIQLVTDLNADVDQPGVYELMAYGDGEANALTLAQNAAQSGRGVLAEQGDGSLHYNDFVARSSFVSLELTQEDMASAGLKTAAQWSEIVNDVNVTYRAGSANARDEQSIILYGQLSGTRDTQLHNLVDAEIQAEQFKEARSFPRVYPEQFVIPLHSDTVSDETRDSLLEIYCGLPITTTDLPTVFGTTFDGFVEGWNWRIRQKEAALTLIASAQSETYSAIVWYQIAPGTTWSAYPALVKWMDL
jgi:hypothetical protein